MGGIQKAKIVFSLFLAALVFSCKKEPPVEPVREVSPIEKKVSGHKWFAFNKDGFVQIERLQDSPAVLKKPWTETLRIAYMAQSAENSPLDIDANSAPKIFALVNKLGMIALDGNENKIYKDDSIFAHRTADKLVFMNGTPIISFYRNSYFNEKHSAQESFRPFLVQFVQDSGVFFPILTYENLSLDENSEVNDFCWNGEQWFCSTKTASESETKFSYVKFKPETALLSISPEKNFISIEKSSEEEFRAQRSPKDFNFAPERVKDLLGSIPDNFNFYAECKLAGGATPREFLHGKISSSNKMRKATVQISDTWIAAMFQDGTTYLKGALYSNKIINGGKTIALLLPKLPRGYVYSDFGISGTLLFAAWEETEFYKTGRAGFIEVDLAKILYKD